MERRRGAIPTIPQGLAPTRADRAARLQRGAWQAEGRRRLTGGQRRRPTGEKRGRRVLCLE